MRKKELIKLNEELFNRHQATLKQLEELVEENKKLISDISLLSSTDRIEKIATEELGMHKAETSDTILS